jgi:hypothetical protein
VENTPIFLYSFAENIICKSMRMYGSKKIRKHRNTDMQKHTAKEASHCGTIKVWK